MSDDEAEHIAILERRFSQGLETSPEERYIRGLRQTVRKQFEDPEPKHRVGQMNSKVSPELRALIRADAKMKKIKHEVEYLERAVHAFSRHK